MGHFFSEAKVNVGLVGLADDVWRRLQHRLRKMTDEDIGTVTVSVFETIKECEDQIASGSVSAVCIDVSKFEPNECTSFVSDIRAKHPLIPFCLIGSKKQLKELPGYEPYWKKRFGHYYKLEHDCGEDFETNAGMVRDLFVADAVKCNALGHYDTTPGGVIKVRTGLPKGSWIGWGVALLAAVLGPVVTYFFLEGRTKRTEDVGPAPTAQQAPAETTRTGRATEPEQRKADTHPEQPYIGPEKGGKSDTKTR